MENPVYINEDSRHFSKEPFEAWCNSLHKRGLPIVSPLSRRQFVSVSTGQPLTLEEIFANLHVDEEFAAEIRNYREFLAKAEVNETKSEGVEYDPLIELNRLFSCLDPLQRFFSSHRNLSEWKPSQVVVIGQER